jgi:hypothetical protein
LGNNIPYLNDSFPKPMNEKYKDILIFYENSIDFFNPYFIKKGFCIQKSYSHAPLYSKAIKLIFGLLKFPQSYWYGDWKRKLPAVSTVIYFATRREAKILKYIKKFNRDIRIIYWYWDPVFRVGPPSAELINIAELWSFDPTDCKRHQMNFNTTFYFSDIVLPESNIEFDAVFLGANKGRKAELQELEEILNTQQLHTYFHIVPDKHEDHNNQPRRMSYHEYLKLIAKAKAIVDVNPVEQFGLTLRPMESIFFKKKLITNDISISYQNFYKPQNISI